MNCQRIIGNWLLDAYNVEQAIMTSLDSYLQEIQDDELRTRIESEINDTDHQSEMIKKRIEELDREILPTESELTTWANSASTITFENEEDRLVRYEFLKFSLKYLERSIVKAISIAAEECNDDKTISICQKILGDELHTAESLDQELYGTVTNFINRSTTEDVTIDWEEGEF